MESESWLLLPDRLIRKLLASHRRLIHKAAFGHRHDGDALAVGEIGRGAGSESNRRSLRVELEFPLLEVVECGRVLEEDDLTVGLPAELQTDRYLGQSRASDQPPALVDIALPPCRTNS